MRFANQFRFMRTRFPFTTVAAKLRVIICRMYARNVRSLEKATPEDKKIDKKNC